MASWPTELQGFVTYLESKRAGGPSTDEVAKIEASLELRLRALESQVGSLRDDFQKTVDEVAKFQRSSNTAADAVSSLRAIVPVSLPRDVKDLKEAVKKLDMETVKTEALLTRLEQRFEDEVLASQKASSLEGKSQPQSSLRLEELQVRIREADSRANTRVDIGGSRQLKQQDSLLQVQDQCSQLSTRMGKLEEMVAGQGKQLLLQAEDQREVHQRLLEVRKEALEGLTQLASLQDSLPEPESLDSRQSARSPSPRSSSQVAPPQERPKSGAARKSVGSQLHPSKLKWTGPALTRATSGSSYPRYVNP
ncbi:unnamed protein product [Effrenium voratum]|uniref:Uncharacterized protein n=1 Tax=Effrenium voratum TaxID=2562239 RepID=A0AA36NCH1_9DINO|nr:unnamed protein product [Effrenium voratum]CAJ1415606.1 unnamed protein product [Effrenium voratum]